MQIVAAQPLCGGQEIYNCYGELSNCELLLKYGFALPDNPFSAVELDKTIIQDAARSAHGVKKFGTRRQFLVDHRCARRSVGRGPVLTSRVRPSPVCGELMLLAMQRPVGRRKRAI